MQKRAIVDNLDGKRILIVLLGAIGDVVRALPLVMRIKHFHPSTHITWAVEPKSRDILIGHPAIDELVVFERGGGWATFKPFLDELRNRKFDIVLDLQRHFKSGFATRWTGAPIRVGFHRKNAKEGNWLFRNRSIPFVKQPSLKIDHYQLFGDALGISPLYPYQFGLEGDDQIHRETTQIILDAFNLANISRASRDFIALVIGSSWPSRAWPVSHYVQFIRTVHQELGLISVLVGGNSERKEAAQIVASTTDTPVVNLVGQTSLRQLASLFQRARAAIGSDSGPSHIAAAVYCPVISLWGSTSPLRSAPYGSEQHVLQSSIGCSPCYRRECPGLENLCMSDIPSAAVFARLRKLISESTEDASPA